MDKVALFLREGHFNLFGIGKIIFYVRRIISISRIELLKRKLFYTERHAAGKHKKCQEKSRETSCKSRKYGALFFVKLV